MKVIAASVFAIALVLTSPASFAGKKNGQSGQNNSTKVVVNSGNSNYNVNSAAAVNVNSIKNANKGWSW